MLKIFFEVDEGCRFGRPRRLFLTLSVEPVYSSDFWLFIHDFELLNNLCLFI